MPLEMMLWVFTLYSYLFQNCSCAARVKAVHGVSCTGCWGNECWHWSL